MVVSGKLGVGPLIMDATWARPFFLRVSSLFFPQTTRTSASSRFFFFLFWGGGRRKAQLAGRDARRAAREVTTADQKTVEEVPGNRVQPNSQQPNATQQQHAFPTAQQLSSSAAEQTNNSTAHLLASAFFFQSHQLLLLLSLLLLGSVSVKTCKFDKFGQKDTTSP